MIDLSNYLGLTYLAVWAIGLLLICYALNRYYRWTVCLAFGMTVFSSLRIYQASLNGMPVNPVVREFISSSQSALISFLLTVMIIPALSAHSWKKVFKAVAALNAFAICADSLFFTVQGIIQHASLSELRAHEPWGVLLNASMSGCLSAAIFPLFESRDRKIRALIFVSIFAAGRSLPVAVLFAGIGARMLLEKRYKTLSIAVLGSFLVGFAVKGKELFEPRGRDFIWTQAFAFFRDHLPWSVGSGLGGFYVVGPALNTQPNKPLFTWLHSDWLQIGFEQGWIGLLVVVVMYLHALRVARSTPPLFAALVAYAAFGVANMPLRYPLAGLFGAFLIRWALEKSKEPEPSPEQT